MATKDVKSEVAGIVWKIEAPIGTNLDEEDPIIILESMKMEIPVSSPDEGTVTEILVKEGDEVAEGQVVARIKPVQ